MLMVNFYLQDAIVRSGHFYYCFCNFVTGQSQVNVLLVLLRESELSFAHFMVLS